MTNQHRLKLLDLEIAAVRACRESDDRDLARASIDREEELLHERARIAPEGATEASGGEAAHHAGATAGRGAAA